MTAADWQDDDGPELRVSVACGFLRRARGLLFRRPLKPNEALLLPRCHAIHTFGMRYAIDAIFLDREARIVAVERVKPWRMAARANAVAVLEMLAGQARAYGIEPGKRVSALRPYLLRNWATIDA